MWKDSPVFIPDIDALRQQVLALAEKDGKRYELWRLLQTSARGTQYAFGWFTPFVALITREERDVENARQIVRTYVDKLEPMSFCSGLQYHFWCFAFPHAKMCLYFQWLCTLGAFDPEEERRIREALILYQYINFYSGMRTKPEPECVDNQTLSLCFSNALTGWLFSRGEEPSAIAALMLEDGLRRLPVVIGSMPPSGYSGEGAAYMDCVNGPAIPLAVELLEQITGETGLLYRDFAGNGARPVHVLEMVARECMPGGLLLPWDNYGYQFGVRAAIAYGACKTGDPLYQHVLENESIWSYDIGTGWAYDDLVWTLVWWPSAPPRATYEPCWYRPGVGGALATADGRRYLMQMWDPSAPVIPTRCHVNPNAVILAGYGVPLSADGSRGPGMTRFQFEDTVRRVSFLAIGTESEYNYGDGCCGAHSCLLVDRCENLRAMSEYEQLAREAGSTAEKWLESDVTPLYRERFADVTRVRRRSALLGERFFVMEDEFRAGAEHEVSSRFLLRPGDVRLEAGRLHLETPEGVTLTLCDLTGRCRITVERAEHYPQKPDDGCLIVDFTTQGANVRHQILCAISRTLREREALTGFAALADDGYAPERARELLQASPLCLPMRLPAFMEAVLPSTPTWWYRKLVRKPRGSFALKLPVGMHAPRLLLNGEEIDLRPFAHSMELIAPRVRLPRALDECEEFELLLRVDVPVDHYAGGGDGTIGMTGGAWLLEPVEEERLLGAEPRDGGLRVRTSRGEYDCAWPRMGEGDA